MTKHTDLYRHAHELTAETVFGNYKVVQNLRDGIVAEDTRTGELTRFGYSGDKLIHYHDRK